MSSLLTYLTENAVVPIVGNFKESFTLTALDDETLETTLRVANGSDLVEAPALALVARSRGVEDVKLTGEIVLIESIDEGDGDLLYIRRFEPKAHTKGELISINVFAEHIALANEALQQALDANVNLKKFLRLSFGTTSNKIIRTTFAPTLDGQVTASDDTVNIAGFNGFINDEPVVFEADSIVYTEEMLPSEGNGRRDLIEYLLDGGLNRKEGNEDSVTYPAPTASDDAIPLGVVELNDGGVVAVTDVREFF